MKTRGGVWVAAMVLGLMLAWSGAAWAQEKPAGNLAEREAGVVTPAALHAASGQNKMVWVTAPKTARPPVIDGTLNLDQGEWADAPAVAGMLMPTSSRLLPLQSLTLITWDDEHFYLGMRTEVKPGYILRRRGRDFDGADGVNRDDAVEIFFNPLGRDQPEPAIFQIMYNALGFRWDAMQTVGVTAKYWDADTWEFKSDYKPGMTHWDLEVKIPVKSMRMKSPNRHGDVWLFLATRDWKNQIDEQGRSLWNIYSSLTGQGGFISQENQFPVVFDDTAPVVQLLDMSALWQGQFGLKARFANTTGKPQTITALASVYDNTGYRGRDQDWSLRENPIVTESKDITLKPGESVEWTIPAAALPELKGDPAKKIDPQYGFVFKVTRPGRDLPVFARQCEFKELAYTARQSAPGFSMDIAFNPVRGTLMPTCDILDHPDPAQVKGLRVELFPAGAAPAGAPLVDALVTRVSHSVLSDLVQLPALAPGQYPARLTLLGTDGAVIESRETAIEKLDEAATFPWWDSRAGLSDAPIPPHQPMKVEGNAVVTTTGRATFDGRAMPAQMAMKGEDLLAGPVRLTAAAGGQPVAFTADAAPAFGKKTATAVELTGALRSAPLTVKVANRMEYDGAQWITLDIEPAAGAVELDYLRLELPFKPERGQFLYTMAMAGRESWVAQDLTQGEGKIWDSAKCRGLGMTVGTFMPQYVISDSLRGLCWFADNDQGWVPSDDVPAAEAVRQGGETILRFNLIGKPFTVTGPRRIRFGLLGLPARPFLPGSRLVERKSSQFGNYVGDKVVNYSSPMPRDFAKARDFMEKGTLYDAKTHEPAPKARAKEWLQEHAPWHDSHTPWKTPDLDPRTYEYLGREFADYGFVPKLINLRAWQWERYVRAAPIDGIYYDTPEGMGFSRSIQNGVAYVIPADQPGAGQVQGGYNMTGFREQIKRIHTIWHQNGVENPWVEMHATHGPVVPATGFLNMLIDGEDFRRPSFKNFMAAWSIPHLRAIDSPSLYGMTVRWLGGYPWDNLARNVDPLRCQMAALFVHDVWTPGFGSWSQGSIAGKGVLIAKCDREPPYGFRNPDMAAKLIGLGMNLGETEFLPYWNNAAALTLARRDGKAAADLRASAWRVPSQNRLIVAVANWEEATVPCTLKVALGQLGAGAADEIVVSDLESDAVLARGKAADTFSFEVLPLDFRLFMVSAVQPAGAAMAPAPGGAGYALKGAAFAAAPNTVTDEALAAKLLALGLNRADAQALPAGDPAVALLGAGGNAVDGVAVGAWRIPAQKRLIVAVANPGEKAAAGKLKFDLGKLGLMPANNGECIIFSDLAADKVLLKTTGTNRGKLLGLWKGLKDEEGRKIASPHDEANVSVPAGELRFFMVATQ